MTVSIIINNKRISPHSLNSVPIADHCLDSFASVEAGRNGEIESLSTLCGDHPGVYLRKDVTAFSVNRYKVKFVSGSYQNVQGFRGFNFTVRAVQSKIDLRNGLIVVYVIAAVAFIMVTCIVAVLVRRKSLKRSIRQERRRRPTWHGNIPTVGESLHVAR